MLVLNVASPLKMIRRRTRVNATRATPTDLPRAKTDTPQQETPSAAQHRSRTTPSVSHALRAIHLPQFSTGGGKQRTVAGNEGELPPPVRSTGGGGLRALERKTEGVRAKLAALTRALMRVNKNAAA